ncbi:MAG: serine/threonine protein kinase [Rubritepida sp.]|nr:serine/threonine protein kinase [Rubritepida sp.]
MSMADAPLPSFGRYQALEVLGTGAMGRVYRALDPLIDRIVAVKIIRADLLEPQERPEFLERFRTEVRAAGRCAHAAIVGVYDFADDTDSPYIVMEFVEGRSLAAALRGDPAERAANAPRYAAAMLEVLDGLSAAHALGVVHRDIKPANIMLTPGGRAKIADFGIARLGLSALTAAGGVIGTPSYMAPEQAMGRPVDHRADLFATAAILYEILLGRAPFAAPSLAETLLRLTAPEPADLGALAGTSTGEVLARGLAKDPAARFASAVEFAAALRTALSGGTVPHDDATRVMRAPASHAAAFDAALIDRLREDIIGRLGPIATTLLRRATATAESEQDLLRACVAMLETSEERVAFMRRHGGGATPSPTVSSVPAMTIAATLELTPAARAKATEALAFVVGPLARILVQKAAGQARSAPEFVDLLCGHASADEAPALRRKLLALF